MAKQPIDKKTNSVVSAMMDQPADESIKGNANQTGKRSAAGNAAQPRRVIWITALITEARPLIRYFSLKKDMQATHFPVYSAPGQLLIISGLGKVKAAMAVSWLLAHYTSDEIAGLINIGFCGTADLSLQTGDLIMAGQVKDADQDRYFYPDLYLASPLGLPIKPLSCWSRPVRSNQSGLESDMPGTCYDMESAGIMEATRLYLQTHQVLIFKIISDHLQPEKARNEISQQTFNQWFNKHIMVLSTACQALRHLDQQTHKPLLADINHFIDAAAGDVKLTTAMRQQLFDKTRQLMLAKPNEMPELAEACLTRLIAQRNPIRHKLGEKKTFQVLIKIMDEAINRQDY